MAVVYRHPEPYRPVIESVFAEAEIPVYLHEGTPLIERPLGRRVSALLDLIDGDLERRAVMEFLTDARLPEATRERYGGHPRRAGTASPARPASSRASTSGASASTASSEASARTSEHEWDQRRSATRPTT